MGKKCEFWYLPILYIYILSWIYSSSNVLFCFFSNNKSRWLGGHRVATAEPQTLYTKAGKAAAAASTTEQSWRRPGGHKQHAAAGDGLSTRAAFPTSFFFSLELENKSRKIGTRYVCMYVCTWYVFMYVCFLCFLPIHSGHQVRWTYQPGSHRRKVTQDFSSTFFLRCVPYFFSREGVSHFFPSSTVKSIFLY